MHLHFASVIAKLVAKLVRKYFPNSHCNTLNINHLVVLSYYMKIVVSIVWWSCVDDNFYMVLKRGYACMSYAYIFFVVVSSLIP